MLVVVVGGGGRGVGKTALMCGVIAALKERNWTAVKIASHAHGADQPVWEESEAGERSDTARYLAAGAQRAFLLTAVDDATMQTSLDGLWERVEHGANLIIESNRVLSVLKADLCLMVRAGADGAEQKASFESVISRADALIVPGAADTFRDGPPPEFQLARVDRISQVLEHWIRGRLIYG